MRQQREADSDHDCCGGINRQKANTWLFFKLWKLTSRLLFVGERRHEIWDTEETQIPMPCRAENTEKKSFLEWIRTLGYWWTSLNETPKARDLSTRKEIIINLGLIWNKTYTSLSMYYENPIMRWGREKKRLCKVQSKWTYNWSIFKFLLLYSCWREWKINYRMRE